jgi:hypothetical protein
VGVALRPEDDVLVAVAYQQLVTIRSPRLLQGGARRVTAGSGIDPKSSASDMRSDSLSITASVERTTRGSGKHLSRRGG